MPKSKQRKGHSKKKANNRKGLEAIRHGRLTRQHNLYEQTKAEMQKRAELKDEAAKAVHKNIVTNKELTDNTTGMIGAAASETKPKTLVEVIPDHLIDEFRQSKSCEKHGQTIVTSVTSDEDWPGTQRNVETWWKLENGHAVGVNIFRGKHTFPTIKLSLVKIS